VLDQVFRLIWHCRAVLPSKSPSAGWSLQPPDGLPAAPGVPQDDPLVKHCLDFIAVVASSVEAARQLAASTTGPAAATLAAAAEQGAAELVPALAAAAPAVVQAASAAVDPRIRAVALRTLHALLCSPGADAQVRPRCGPRC
jgi:hypothetical protein